MTSVIADLQSITVWRAQFVDTDLGAKKVFQKHLEVEGEIQPQSVSRADEAGRNIYTANKVLFVFDDKVDIQVEDYITAEDEKRVLKVLEVNRYRGYHLEVDLVELPPEVVMGE